MSAFLLFSPFFYIFFCLFWKGNFIVGPPSGSRCMQKENENAAIYSSSDSQTSDGRLISWSDRHESNIHQDTGADTAGDNASRMYIFDNF